MFPCPTSTVKMLVEANVPGPLMPPVLPLVLMKMPPLAVKVSLPLLPMVSVLLPAMVKFKVPTLPASNVASRLLVSATMPVVWKSRLATSEAIRFTKPLPASKVNVPPLPITVPTP